MSQVRHNDYRDSCLKLFYVLLSEDWMVKLQVRRPDCSIFLNEAIRKVDWMEIRLSFTVPQERSERKGIKGNKTAVCISIDSFVWEAPRAPVKIDQTKEPPLILTDLFQTTPQYQKCSMLGKKCELWTQPGNYYRYITQSSEDQTWKRQRMLTRACNFG